MKIIVFSGGTGKRKWPLSGNGAAKQYLPVLEGPFGRQESMLQRLWRQLGAADLLEHTWIATSGSHAAIVRQQAGAGAKLIAEPEARDTWPAAGLAASYLHSIAGIPLHETLVMLPVDTYVDGGFFHCIRSLPKLLGESAEQLLMVGVKPAYSGGLYDYILPELGEDDELRYDCPVKAYYERPCEAQAEELIECGALWNSGVYAVHTGVLLSRLAEMEMIRSVCYEELYGHFAALRKMSLEQALIQDKVFRKSVLPYEGEWARLTTSRQLSEQAIIGKY